MVSEVIQSGRAGGRAGSGGAKVETHAAAPARALELVERSSDSKHLTRIVRLAGGCKPAGECVSVSERAGGWEGGRLRVARGLHSGEQAVVCVVR